MYIYIFVGQYAFHYQKHSIIAYLCSDSLSGEPVSNITSMYIRVADEIKYYLYIYINIFSYIPSWTLAIMLGHINPIFPYLSDLGVVPPEASLFSLNMCVGGALVGLFVLLRYDLNRSIVDKSMFVTIYEPAQSNESTNERHIKDANIKTILLKRNNVSLITGLFMSFGFILIGCFRNNEIHLVQILHHAFALGTFICFIVDIYHEYKIANLAGWNRVSRYRVIILGLSIFFFVVYTTNGVASYVVNTRNYLEKDARLLWSSHEAGYLLHVISTFVEWLLIYMFSAYFYTFHSMFVNANYLKAPTITTTTINV